MPHFRDQAITTHYNRRPRYLPILKNFSVRKYSIDKHLATHRKMCNVFNGGCYEVRLAIFPAPAMANLLS